MNDRLEKTRELIALNRRSGELLQELLRRLQLEELCPEVRGAESVGVAIISTGIADKRRMVLAVEVNGVRRDYAMENVPDELRRQHLALASEAGRFLDREKIMFKKKGWL